MPPLILTLALDAASEAFFEAARQRWFPPERNLIPAHVTLFHHLPGEDGARLAAALARLCAAQRPAPVTVGGLRFLGRGVAYTLAAPEVAAFRAELARLWAGDLTAQDRQPWRPHVTVQNKVEPPVARALHERLLRDFVPFGATAVGVRLWRYLGGPWALESGQSFRGGPASSCGDVGPG
jgi:2'-5' RNA ligase